MLPRVQGTTVIQPFTVTHPLPTLSLSLTQGFTLPARLALREVINAAKFVWDTTSGGAELGSFMLDLQTLKRIHEMRNSHVEAYKSFIHTLPYYKQSSGCAACALFWKLNLLKKVEQAPNSVAFSAAFLKGYTCTQCSQYLMSNYRGMFETFIAKRATEECTLPELR